MPLDLTEPASFTDVAAAGGTATADLLGPDGWFTQDVDGDALAIADAWIERIVYTNETSEDLGKAHPSARQPWFSFELTPVADGGAGESRRALTPSIDDAVLVAGDVAKVALGIEVTDGANSAEGVCWVYSSLAEPGGLPVTPETKGYWDVAVSGAPTSGTPLPNLIDGSVLTEMSTGGDHVQVALGTSVGALFDKLNGGVIGGVDQVTADPGDITLLFVGQWTETSASFYPVVRFQGASGSSDETTLSISVSEFRMQMDNGSGTNAFTPARPQDTALHLFDLRSFADGTFSLRLDGGTRSTAPVRAGREPFSNKTTLRLMTDQYRDRIFGAAWIIAGDPSKAELQPILDYVASEWGITIGAYS